jgi:L-malate glycosyltransferase
MGDGELKAALIATVERLGRVAQCSFVDARPQAEIPLWFSLLVLCSRMQGLPTVLSEALMSQVLIIVTLVGGIPELTTHGDTGLLVPTIDHRRGEVVPTRRLVSKSRNRGLSGA